MRQIGNLAVVCANRPDVLMQIQGRSVAVFVGRGPQRLSVGRQFATSSVMINAA